MGNLDPTENQKPSQNTTETIQRHRAFLYSMDHFIWL